MLLVISFPEAWDPKPPEPSLRCLFEEVFLGALQVHLCFGLV